MIQESGELKKIYAVWISCACVRNKDGYTAVTVYINGKFAQVMAEGQTQGKYGTENGTLRVALRMALIMALRMALIMALRMALRHCPRSLLLLMNYSGKKRPSNRQIIQKTSWSVLQSGN